MRKNIQQTEYDSGLGPKGWRKYVSCLVWCNITLHELRYNLFEKSLKTTKLEFLPPTSASSAQHSFRMYYQVQQWLSNKLVPEEWGWIRRDGELQPVKTTSEPSSDEIHKLISCTCKGNYLTQQWNSVKSGIKYSIICKIYEGGTCSNTESDDS